MAAERINITDVVISDDGTRKCLEFCIMGEPHAQNGWRIRHRGLQTPIMFDPLARLKRQIKDALAKVMMEHQEPLPVFAAGIPLRVGVIFHLRHVATKDVDNMAKFLLDAIEEVVFNNDKYIIDLSLSKSTNETPKTLVFVATF